MPRPGASTRCRPACVGRDSPGAHGPVPRRCVSRAPRLGSFEADPRDVDVVRKATPALRSRRVLVERMASDAFAEVRGRMAPYRVTWILSARVGPPRTGHQHERGHGHAGAPTRRIHLWAWAHPRAHATPGHGVCRARVSPARHRAHRAPSGGRRAPRGVPARGGRGRRRPWPAAVRRAGVPGVPEMWPLRERRGRFRCDGCAREHLVPFSCKGRGFCPSCGGRRMTERAAHLVDEVLPRVPVRQWVLTMPYRLRYRMAFDHGLSRAVLGVYTRALFDIYARGARARGVTGDAPAASR